MDTPLWPDDDAFVARLPIPVDQPFTPAQAARLGLSRQRLRGLVDRGYVRRVLRGVYAASQAPDDLRLRAQAVALVVPPRSIVTDRTAAWLHGVSILPRTSLTEPPPIQVFRTDGPRVRRRGVAAGQRQLVTRDITKVHGVLVTTPLRTACDLGRLLWSHDALAALDGMLRIGVPHEELLREVERFKGYRGVRQLRVLAPIADGLAESPPESALRWHWIGAGLPTPALQHWVYDERGHAVYRLDLALPEIRYAAEYDGAEFHSSPLDRRRDAVRREWLTTRDWHIDVFTYVDVYGPTANPAAQMRRSIAEARRTQAIWTPGFRRNHN